LVIVMAGRRDAKHWLTSEPSDLDFFDLKGVVETILSRLHVTDVAYHPTQDPTYQSGRAAILTKHNVPFGLLGELHPAVREAYDLPARRVAVADIDLEHLLLSAPLTWFVEPVSSYPAVLQDLAVVVDETVPAAAVQALIVETAGPLLKQVQLFDLYRGAPVPEGKKSLAYALAFQAPDKTLSDSLVAKQVERIMQRLKKELGAELRA
jgi:phenylalanyl-tRNA synthetase beta chain